MTTHETRRGFLKVGAAAIATGVFAGLSGCSSLPGDSDGGGSASAEALNVVPSGVTAVAYVDVGGMLEDSAVEKLLNKTLELAAEEPGYSGPTTKEELLQQIEESSDLDPAGMGEVVSFGTAPDVSGESTPAPGAQYAGTWFTTDWSEDEVLSTIQSQGMELEEGTYEDHTVYEPASEFGQSWMGVLAEGEFVAGTEDAVKDSIDVAEGNADSVGSDLKDPYSSVRSGLFKTATTVPAENLPDRTVSEGGVEVDPQRIAQVQSGAVSAYHDGDEVGMESSMAVEDDDAAEDIRDILRGAIAAAENTVASDRLAEELDTVDVERDGTTITIDYANSVDAAVELLGIVVEELRTMNEDSGEQPMSIDPYPLA